MYRRTKSDEIKGGNCFVFLHKERKNNYNKTTAVTTRTIKKKKKKKKKSTTLLQSNLVPVNINANVKFDAIHHLFLKIFREYLADPPSYVKKICFLTSILFSSALRPKMNPKRKDFTSKGSIFRKEETNLTEFRPLKLYQIPPKRK